MNLPLQITFRDLPSSEAVEARIREHVAKLETVYDRIVSCRVSVEAPHRHHQHGGHYRIRVDLKVPGKEIVVGRDPVAKADNEDIYVAIRDAFRATKLALQEYVRERRFHRVPPSEMIG